MGIVWTGSSHGVDWHLELERNELLPGRLVAGRVGVTAHGDVDARGLLVTLHGVEHWKHRVTSTDGQGHTTTHVKTESHEIATEPVQVEGALHLGAGEAREWAFELPVPPLGPATLEADVAGLDWTVEAKLDMPGGFDASIEAPVRVVQPVALLRSGALTLPEFALYDTADVAEGEVTGSVALAPVPLCSGRPFTGTIELHAAGGRRLQEVRVELRVRVAATVSNGLEETVVAWADAFPITELAGDLSIPVAGALDARALPSIELPHARASASFHVILATAWAQDPHLVRDVAVATTLEL